MSELVFPWAETIRAGLRDYVAANPWRLTLTTTWPRAVFQGLFFTLLGGITYGSGGEDFALVGSAGLVLALSTVVGIADVSTTDKWMGTSYRIRLGRLPAFAVVAARSLPWLLEGVLTAVASVLVIGVLTGRVGLALTVVSSLPVLVVMAASSGAAGLTAAAVAAGRDAEILVGNVLLYFLLAAGGVLVPPGRLTWLDAAGGILPVTHGLRALRARVDGRPWLAQLGLEVLVGVLWAAVAWAVYRRQARRARQDDEGAFA